MAEKTRKKVWEFLNAVSEKQNLTLCSDREHVDSIAEGLMEMYNLTGYFGCPCRESWNDRKKDRDIICPCDYCRPDIEEYGQCYCGLFVSENNPEREINSIPDRRKDEMYP